MRLLFSVLRIVLPSRQNFPRSWNFPRRQVRRVWVMTLLLLALRVALLSRQRFPGSWNSPHRRQVRWLGQLSKWSSLTVHLDLPPPTSERGYNVQYSAIHWLNDDILLGIFNCYRLDEKNGWNDRHLWCKLSHVCQRWRHLIYEYSSHLGMHIKCTDGSPVVNTLDHLPLLPLFVHYYCSPSYKRLISEKDELWIYHTLRLHGRIRHIKISLPPFLLHNVIMHMDENFPILEHLSLSRRSFSDRDHRLPLTLPQAFLAPNLRHLTLSDIGPPKRLRVLTLTVSLVTLELTDIHTSSYFRPRLLVARLRSLPLLEELYIRFSVPIPRPSTERELLGENRDPVTLPSLKTLEFKGVGAYLESLVAQIRAPLLETLYITLSNQIALVLPHLFYLINNTKVFKLSRAAVSFRCHEVCVSSLLGWTPFRLSVSCRPLDWQIDGAAQICHALIPILSGAQELTFDSYNRIPPELRHGAAGDSATWHDLLRIFIGVQDLDINGPILEELSRALQVDEVGSDPGFLPNLRSIHAKDNLFTSFIDTRQVVGRPVRFVGHIITVQ